MIPERFSPLPFDALTIGGTLAERMGVNLNRRLLRIDETKLVACFLAASPGRLLLRFHFALSLC
jgi:hypothetical protein